MKLPTYFDLPAMKPKSASISSADDLEIRAGSAMERHQYREAIAFYKDLLKRERRPEWERGLADAYRQRAFQVAEKGMYQEATILWDNHAKLSPQAECPDAYVGWLLRVGQYAKVAELLGKQPEEAQTPWMRQLPEVMALMALENDKLLGCFLPEHPIAKHHATTKKAIAAYGAKRDDEAEEALRQIPSRSPYRNVRTLLKAMMLMEQDRAAGLGMLEKIGTDSACRGFAEMLLGQVRQEGPELDAYFGLSAKCLGLVNKINGYGKTQFNLMRDAKKAATSNSPRLVFEAVINNRELLGNSASRRFCLAALVEYPSGITAFEHAFGKLPAFEHHRLQALHEESLGYYPDAAHHWGKCIETLAKRPAQERDKLDEALIFRHIAELASGPVPEIAVDALRKSLDLDPDDKESYLTLIKLCETLDDSKAAQEWMEKGLKCFPKDVDLLLLAMNVASRRKAFKKAASLAKSLLDIDPINSQARQFLIDAHIGHARKQFRAGRANLAQQEMEQARSLDPHRRNAGLSLAEGLLALAGDKDAKRAEDLLKEGWHIAGGGLCARFLLDFETLCLGLPLNAPTRIIPALGKSYVAKREELLGLIKLIDRAADEKKRLTDALEKLRPVLKRSFKQAELTEDDYFNGFQTLARTGQYAVLGDCAKEAQLHYPLTAGPVYFEIFAKCKGVAKRMSGQDEYRLELAEQRLRGSKDQRVGILIENFFRELDESLDNGFKGGMPFDLDGLNPNMLPAIMKRVTELEMMPRSELFAIIADAIPGLPLKNLPDEGLMDIARLVAMGEFGFDIGGMLDMIASLDTPKKSPKSR